MEMMDVDNEVVMGQGPENQETCVKWARPPPLELNPQKDALTFQQIDIDNYIGSPINGMPGPQVYFDLHIKNR